MKKSTYCSDQLSHIVTYFDKIVLVITSYCDISYNIVVNDMKSIPCSLIWYHITPYHKSSDYIRSCNTIKQNVSYDILTYHIILHDIISYNIISHHIMSYYIISHHIISNQLTVRLLLPWHDLLRVPFQVGHLKMESRSENWTNPSDSSHSDPFGAANTDLNQKSDPGTRLEF